MLIDVNKWEEILDLISSREIKTISFIAKELNITYTHVMKILKQLKELGLVKIKTKGRNRSITLTPKGLNIAVHCSPIVNFIKQNSGGDKR